MSVGVCGCGCGCESYSHRRGVVVDRSRVGPFPLLGLASYFRFRVRVVEYANELKIKVNSPKEQSRTAVTISSKNCKKSSNSQSLNVKETYQNLSSVTAFSSSANR